MTLIVYKDGILAGDSRSSATIVSVKDFSCAHCNAESKPVHDCGVTSKVEMPRSRYSESDAGKFEGQKILAYGLSGDSMKCKAVAKILRFNHDLAEAHRNYLALRNPREEGYYSCTALLVCEHNVFVIEIPAKGSLKVEQRSHEEFTAIGSGSGGARWINHLLPDFNAVNIINLVMAKDITVGGDINYIEVFSEKPEIKKGVKGDPKEMLELIQQAFVIGSSALSVPTQEQGETT